MFLAVWFIGLLLHRDNKPENFYILKEIGCTLKKGMFYLFLLI